MRIEHLLLGLCIGLVGCGAPSLGVTEGKVQSIDLETRILHLEDGQTFWASRDIVAFGRLEVGDDVGLAYENDTALSLYLATWKIPPRPRSGGEFSVPSEVESLRELELPAMPP
ncbi:MAG: hypothetical protein ACE5Q3_17040 [Alphaproteobacteria bacterium]